VQLSLLTRRKVTAAEVSAYGSVQIIQVAVVTNAWLATMAAPHSSVFLWTVDAPTAWEHYSGRVAGIITNDAPGYIRYRATAPGCQSPSTGLTS
jgi:hypothetical protein